MIRRDRRTVWVRVYTVISFFCYLFLNKKKEIIFVFRFWPGALAPGHSRYKPFVGVGCLPIAVNIQHILGSEFFNILQFHIP